MPPCIGLPAITAKCPRVYTSLKQIRSGVPMTAVFRTVRLALSLCLGLVVCGTALAQGDASRLAALQLRVKAMAEETAYVESHHQDPAAGPRLRLLHRQGLLRRSGRPVYRRRHLPVGRRRRVQGQGPHPGTADSPRRRQHEGGPGTSLRSPQPAHAVATAGHVAADGKSCACPLARMGTAGPIQARPRSGAMPHRGRLCARKAACGRSPRAGTS